MTDVSSLLGQLIGRAQFSPQPNPDPSVGLPSLAQAPPDLTGAAGARPFSHEQIVQKHGLSNILNILGDAFLASHGLQPQYLPKLQAARAADATEDYDSNPLEAIKRLALVDPNRADQMRNDLYTNMYKGQLARTSAAAEQKDLAAVPGTQAESQSKVLLPLAGLVGKATADTYPGIRAYADNTLRANGLGPVADLLPQKFHQNGITNWAQSALTPAQQAQIDYRNRRGDQFDEQLGLNRENVHSEVDYRGTMAGVAQQNADTNDKRAKDQSRNIDDMISYRAWQKQDGSRKTASLEDWRKWQEAHPPKGRGGTAPPVGYQNANGLTFKGGDPNDRKNWK